MRPVATRLKPEQMRDEIAAATATESRGTELRSLVRLLFAPYSLSGVLLLEAT
jgi:hypothetical protein